MSFLSQAMVFLSLSSLLLAGLLLRVRAHK